MIMAEKKPTLVDFGLKVLRQLLAEKPAAAQTAASTRVKIDEIPLDDLKREKVRLEQEERKLMAQMREMEGEKKKLFSEGVRNSSEREQRVLARRIKELETRADGVDRILQAISKQVRTIGGLIQIKERIRMQNESGLSSVIGAIDLNDLITFVDQASVDGEFQMSKFDELLRAMEQSEAVSPQYSEDEDVLDIVKQMQMAREAADSPEAMEQHFEELNHRHESQNREADEEEI